MVLLHAGSNDILHSVDVSTAPDRLGTLIDTVISATGASVLVARIISLGEGYTEYNTLVDTYNAAIPAIVAARVAEGKNVAVADMSSAVKSDELIDGIHPIAAGYKKMAAVVSQTSTLFPSCSTSFGPKQMGWDGSRDLVRFESVSKFTNFLNIGANFPIVACWIEWVEH